MTARRIIEPMKENTWQNRLILALIAILVGAGVTLTNHLGLVLSIDFIAAMWLTDRYRRLDEARRA